MSQKQSRSSTAQGIFASNLLDDDTDEENTALNQSHVPDETPRPPQDEPAPAPKSLPSLPSSQPTHQKQAEPAQRQRTVNGGPGRLVIAIDYGTTYTGVAYATPRSADASLKDITLVRDWGSNMGNHNKIPSVISYTPSSTGSIQWGSSISSNAVTYVNTKMELEIGESQLDELELIQQVLDSVGALDFEAVKKEKISGYTWKSPEGIVTDYLTQVFNHLKKSIDHFGERLRGLLQVDIVVTVPVNWSYRAKNSTLRAIRKAGFNETTFPRIESIILVTEPEAAAIYTARHLKEDKEIEFLEACNFDYYLTLVVNLGECFILCDAGGGTVDCVSYMVKKLNPLELEKITLPTSGKCGSAYVDAEFKRWLKEVLGDSYGLLDPRGRRKRISPFAAESKEMRELVKAFQAHKNVFPQKDKKDINIFLPLPEGNLYRIIKPGVLRDGELTITHDKMKALFDNCVNSVVTLIDDQLDQLIRKGYEVRNVFLVGGFSESPYLQDEVKNSLLLRGTNSNGDINEGITMRRPDSAKAWTAVVQGAVMYGIEKYRQQGIKTMQFCKETFGVAMIPILSHSHNANQSNQGLNQRLDTIATGHVKWLIRKGDLLLSDEPKVETKEVILYSEVANVVKFSLPVLKYTRSDEFYSEKYHVAKNVSIPLAMLNCTLPNSVYDDFDQYKSPNSGTIYYQIPLSCRATLLPSNLTVEVFYCGKRLDSVRVEFEGEETDEEP